MPIHRRRPRILVLTPRDPYPVIGGDRLRIHRLARELARHYELTLLTLCESEEKRFAPAPDDGVFTRVYRVVLPRWRSWLNVLAALPTREPLQVAYYRSREFREAVKSLAPEHDVVLAHLVRTADYARELNHPCVLEMTDAISMSMQRIAASKLGYFDFRRLVYAVESRRLARHERRIAEHFDVVAFNSDVDRKFLFGTAQHERERIIVVPNGADVPRGQPPPQSQRRPGEIVFLGNMQSLQNFDAAWFFARHVLPLVRARRPDAILRIVGEIPPASAARLRALPGVRIEGFAPSVEAALATARVGVCAARLSSGMQNKLLDYLANRLAVVCSPIALEGLNAWDGEHLLLAETPEQWAECVLKLLHDEAYSQRLADAGRALASRHYQWNMCVRPLLTRIGDLLQQKAEEIRADAIVPVKTSSKWTATDAPRSKSSVM